MSEINVHLDQEQVTKAVAQAVLDSTIGKLVEEQLNAVFKDRYSTQQMVKTLAEEEVRKILRDLLEGPDYRPAIEAKVRDLLNEQALDEIVQASARSLIDVIERTRRGY